jgi:hypothetical protein
LEIQTSLWEIITGADTLKALKNLIKEHDVRFGNKAFGILNRADIKITMTDKL